MPVKIKLVAPPLYVMMTTTLQKEKGIELLENACKAISDTIRPKRGELNIKTAARAVSERDDRILTALMENLGQQNQEVGGDDEHDIDE